jgi:diguanylate cyclase (GGDEF)-like protein
MLSPSWPTPADALPFAPPQVQRRVDAVQRRALRNAVTVTGGLMTALLILDLGMNLLIGTPGIAALAPFSLAAATTSGAAAFFAHRGSIRVEPLGLVATLAVFSVTLMGEVLTPTGRMLGSAQLAMILVGIGLFLPWRQRWHIAALSSAGGLAIAFVLSPIGSALGATDQVNLIVAVVMAATVSMVGHRLSQGRARTMLEQQFTLRRLSRYARLQETNVKELNRELNVVARRDSLTGIGNRLALDEAIVRLLDQRSRIRPLPFALILFDLDHFKAYNDEHGHQAGDAALGRIGEILLRATRLTDVAFRYGGEEFLLLVPDTDLTGAIAVAERVRVATEEPSDLPPFTISGGVALWDPIDGRDPQPLLRRADTALYLAKRAGRNRILADELSVAMQRQKIASA